MQLGINRTIKTAPPSRQSRVQILLFRGGMISTRPRGSASLARCRRAPACSWDRPAVRSRSWRAVTDVRTQIVAARLRLVRAAPASNRSISFNISGLFFHVGVEVLVPAGRRCCGSTARVRMLLDHGAGRSSHSPKVRPSLRGGFSAFGRARFRWSCRATIRPPSGRRRGPPVRREAGHLIDEQAGRCLGSH